MVPRELRVLAIAFLLACSCQLPAGELLTCISKTQMLSGVRAEQTDTGERKNKRMHQSDVRVAVYGRSAWSLTCLSGKITLGPFVMASSFLTLLVHRPFPSR